MIITPKITSELEKLDEKFNFKSLPAFAAFISQHHLKEFTSSILQYSRELELPMLKFMSSLTESELLDLGMKANAEMLDMIAKGKAGEFINKSVVTWLMNQSTIMSSEQIEFRDLISVAFIRRKTFRKFLLQYSKDPVHHLEILNEADEFTSEIESLCMKLLLEIQQGLYREAQALSGMGNWVWNLINNKITWSDEVYKIYGLDPTVKLKYGETDLNKFTHPDDIAMVKAEISNSISSGKPHDFFYRIRLEGGIEKTLHAKGQVQMNVDGTPIRLIGTLQDVTRQKRNEQELREKQYFIEKIANVTPSLIAAYNIHTGQYLFVNQSLKPLLGYESSDLLEKGAAFIVPLVHPEDLPDLMKQNQQALEMANSPETISNGIEPVVEFKYRLLHKNGEYRWFQTLGTVFNRNAENKVETLLNISVDITEQVRVSQELIRINSELQHQQNKRSIAEEKLKEYARNLKDVNNNLTRSNQELQQFAYAASHDLQEPLRKIIIFSGKLQQEYKELLPEMGKEYINKMVSSSARMTRLIDDLLNFSRVSRSEDKFENVNLNEILQNVLNDFEVVIAQKNAIISYDHLPVIPAIPLQMTQLFQNIISNALKFSKQSSPPMINISLQKEITDELSNFPQLSHNIPYYKLTFKDNGIGFNQTYSEQIFTIFQRLHGKSEYSGTGIGLALCRKIADNHNGIIFARSEEEKGAEFHILLPAQQTVSGVTNTSSAT